MQTTQNAMLSSKQYLGQFDCILQDMIRGMTAPKPEGSISGLFIRQMIPHHEAAIRMSENLLQFIMPQEPMPFSGDIIGPLSKIAENIIAEQTESIKNMKSSFHCCSQYENTSREIRSYQNVFRSVTDTMFCQMRRAPRTTDIPYNFIREMIPHHEGAIRMSENALRFPVCQELVPILDTIITSQKRGILRMQQLLNR